MSSKVPNLRISILQILQRITNAKSQKIAPSLIPPGWSAEPADLAKASEDFPRSENGISDSDPVTALLVDQGAKAMRLVECPEGTYYLWNAISDCVWKVLAPTTLEELVPKLGDPNMEGVEIQELAV